MLSVWDFIYMYRGILALGNEQRHKLSILWVAVPKNCQYYKLYIVYKNILVPVCYSNLQLYRNEQKNDGLH